MVPRLSIILTLVILCVVFSVSTLVLHGPDAQPPSRAVADGHPHDLDRALPRDRRRRRPDVRLEAGGRARSSSPRCATWCSDGTRSATGCSTYPEVHFFTIAAFILLGRYAGYRLTELWRFRDLVEPSEPAR